ncbi:MULTISPECIES: MerR family transcriptional regulator [unclassified Pseudomonas]|uniref:MerR family transcriptional regulator n=1 Tax=unclassified Pseudomonas TaxID=196821 RepID=UPI003917C656
MPTFSISDLANELNVTTRTIRFYEERGMVTPARRGLERIYNSRDRVILKLILRGKRIGFSLNECKELIDMYDPSGGNEKQLERFLEKIVERVNQLNRQAQDIQLMKAELDGLALRCQTTLASTQNSVTQLDLSPIK